MQRRVSWRGGCGCELSRCQGPKLMCTESKILFSEIQTTMKKECWTPPLPPLRLSSPHFLAPPCYGTDLPTLVPTCQGVTEVVAFQHSNPFISSFPPLLRICILSLAKVAPLRWVFELRLPFFCMEPSSQLESTAESWCYLVFSYPCKPTFLAEMQGSGHVHLCSFKPGLGINRQLAIGNDAL